MTNKQKIKFKDFSIYEFEHFLNNTNFPILLNTFIEILQIK